MDSQPHSQLTSKLAAYAATNHRVHLLDCSRIYLDATGTHVSPPLMPGGLHPSKAGEHAQATNGMTRLQKSTTALPHCEQPNSHDRRQCAIIAA